MLVGAAVQRWEEKANTVLYFQTLIKKKIYAVIPTTSLGLSNTFINIHFIAAREKCPTLAVGRKEAELETE